MKSICAIFYYILLLSHMLIVIYLCVCVKGKWIVLMKLRSWLTRQYVVLLRPCFQLFIQATHWCWIVVMCILSVVYAVARSLLIVLEHYCSTGAVVIITCQLCWYFLIYHVVHLHYVLKNCFLFFFVIWHIIIDCLCVTVCYSGAF